ncbi:MAG: preprotein translocase subunit YajC [Ilumatobacteraceae bacterium]|jgi:preprotein translocase subunit YajC
MFSSLIALLSPVFANEAAEQSTGGGIVGLLPLLLIFVLMYFLLLRPQRRRQKAMAALQSSLAVDDDVVLTNGIFATVTGIEDNWLWVEVADGVQIRVTKGSIGQKVGAEPDADKKKK